MKKPHRLGDRLGANSRIKSHRIAGRCSDARTEGGRVEGLRLAVDEQSRPLRPEQEERTFFRADVVRVEARRGEVGNRPCMVGARVDHGFDRPNGNEVRRRPSNWQGLRWYGLRACVRSLSSGGATRRPVGASRNDKQKRRVSRLRDACIVRLTRPLLRERLFRYGVPTHRRNLP